MKSILYSLLFLLTTSNSIAQTSVSDTTIHVRGNVDYYIDGIRVRGNARLPKTSLEEVTVIIGGLPVNYGDLNSSIIQVNTAPVMTIPRRISDKEQKLATE